MKEYNRREEAWQKPGFFVLEQDGSEPSTNSRDCYDNKRSFSSRCRELRVSPQRHGLW
jgi:hypothetical protein